MGQATKNNRSKNAKRNTHTKPKRNGKESPSIIYLQDQTKIRTSANEPKTPRIAKHRNNNKYNKNNNNENDRIKKNQSNYKANSFINKREGKRNGCVLRCKR